MMISRVRLTDVIHVSSAHPYTDNRIHYRECQTLAEAGYNVALIAVETQVTGPPSDVQVLTIPPRPRALRVLLSSTQAAYLAWKSGAGVVHLHDPELIPFIPFFRAAGRKVIYDAHEDLPLQVLTKPYLSRNAGRAMGAAAHLLIGYTRIFADRIVAATNETAERYQSGKTVVVHNYPQLRVEEDVPTEKADILVYVGAITKSRGIMEMLNSVETNEFPEGWELHIAGDADAESLKAINDEKTSPKVVYHGKLPPNEARDLLLRSKVGIVAFENNPWHLRAFPTKMFEYFAAGLPVIASDFPVWRGIIEEDDSGTLVDESDPTAIARALNFYHESPDVLRKQSSNARRHALNVRNWGTEGAALVKTYESLFD